MIIHPSIPKRKKKKPNAKQRALQDSWQKLLEKYDVKPASKMVVGKSKPVRATVGKSVANFGSDWRSRVDPSRLTDSIPSVDTGVRLAAKPQNKVYTGDAMIGIGQLYKSNAVPIFKQEDAVAISKMRRG